MGAMGVQPKLDGFDVGCAGLDEMFYGSVYLSVPLLDDTIQVGVGGDLATATIVVTRSSAALSVRRADGTPMQVQIHHEQQGCPGATVRRDVFRRPVHSLHLRRVAGGDGNGRWLVVGMRDEPRRSELAQFIATVARFALTKQREEGPS